MCFRQPNLNSVELMLVDGERVVVESGDILHCIDNPGTAGS